MTSVPCGITGSLATYRGSAGQGACTIGFRVPGRSHKGAAIGIPPNSDRKPYPSEVHAEGPAAVRVVAALAGGPAGPSPQPQHPDSAGSKEAPSPAEAAELSNGDAHNSAAAGSEAALAAEAAQPASELSSRDMDNRATPVHYFVMGPGAAWRRTSAWPPPELAHEPYRLFLGSRCAPAPSLPAEEATCGPGS